MLTTMEVAYIFFSNAVDQILLAAFGILVCVYSLHIKNEKQRNPQYKAMCDINEHMSCSKVLMSEYSKGFGVVELMFGKESTLNVSNSLLGLFFYVMQIILVLGHFSWSPTVLFYSSIASVLGSIYLAYILFFVLKDVCLVCIAIYTVNLSLLYLTYHRYVNVM